MSNPGAGGAGARACASWGPRLALVAVSGAAGALIACRTPAPVVPADVDATASTARAVAIGESRVDELDCEDEHGPDCVDWYRFGGAASGPVELTVAPEAPTPPGEGPRAEAGAEGARAEAPAEAGAEGPRDAPPFVVEVADAEGALVGRASVSEASPIASLRIEAREQEEYVAAVHLAPGTGRHAYRLGLVVRPPEESTSGSGARPVEPAAPAIGRFLVLAVDGAAQSTLLIDGGRARALQAGLRGRLVDGERTLGRIVVEEVYEEGARVRVEGPLTSAVTPDTIAEIELPPAGE